MTPEERKELLRRRTGSAVQTREQKGLGKRQALNLAALPSGKTMKDWDGPKVGKETNAIDILPWVVTQDWYQTLRGVSGLATGIPPGGWDYKLEIPIHRNVGDEGVDCFCLRLAFGKKCPICEDLQIEYDKAKSENRQIDQAVRQALAPSWRNFYNILDLDDQDKGVQQWNNVSFHLFEKFLLEAADLSEGAFETFSDLENGRTIEFAGRKKSLGRNEFTEAGSIAFAEREPYEESIIAETISFDALVHIMTYDEVNKIYLAIPDDGDNKVQEPAQSTRTRTRQSSPPPNTGNRSRYQRQEDETLCSKGHRLGLDNNKFPDCQECDEDEFQKCANKAEGESPSPEPEPEVKMPDPEPKRSRRPPRNAEASTPPARTRVRR